MNKREKFIEVIDNLINKTDMSNFCEDAQTLEDVMGFWEIFKAGKNVGGLTENGEKILHFMQENKESYNNLFKAKDIGEGLFISSRSVSGTMRKLVTDEYVIKTPGNPVVYSLTDKAASL